MKKGIKKERRNGRKRKARKRVKRKEKSSFRKKSPGLNFFRGMYFFNTCVEE